MKPSTFLFHVPWCRDLWDTDEHNFPYKNNWLTLSELEGLPQQNTPKEVEVIQINGNGSRKLGKIATSLAILKFGD